jgi:hypothetical protein
MHYERLEEGDSVSREGSPILGRGFGQSNASAGYRPVDPEHPMAARKKDKEMKEMNDKGKEKDTHQHTENEEQQQDKKAEKQTEEKKKELERKKKISETMKKNPSSGGLRKGSGRGKKGWYKGFWCDSSWELSWVIYNLDHNIPFIRNTQYFTYQMNGKIKKYYPDFIIEDVFYEIKGRRNFEQIDEENKQKIMQFEKKLVVLYEEEMKPYLNYVIDKYGKNFYNLYDKMEE